jgi:hypothetical protein
MLLRFRSNAGKSLLISSRLLDATACWRFYPIKDATQRMPSWQILPGAMLDSLPSLDVPKVLSHIAT